MVGTKRDVSQEAVQTMQLMEFIVSGGHFGINVAKVDEIMKYSQYPVTPMPNANPFVEGIFRPRLETMTVINLAAYMGLPPSEDEDKDILIITKLNGVKTAFHVHGVMAIDTIELDKIEKPDRTIYGEEEGMATGVANFEDRLITIVDFEKILMDINPQTASVSQDLKRLGNRAKNTKPILLVEDSPMLIKLVMESLEQAGYVNITCTANGREAWELLTQYSQAGGPIDNYVAAVITDIEMPLMDGHRLLKHIRDDKNLKDLPVIIFSTLITEDLRAIGERLGANAQIAKLEIARVVELLDEFIK